MKARIFQPARSAMQSATAISKGWRLEFELKASRQIDPLMGWTSSSDTGQQVSLFFKTKEAAILFAKNSNLEYNVVEPQERVIKPKNYAANFAHNRID